MPVRNMAVTGLFAALLAVSSQIAIPIGPVPHTLQIFFVMLSGVVLGGRWGFMSVAVWILLGVFGLPVFAQGKAGLAVLAGPTGGFLGGFAVSAYLVGRFCERGELSFVGVTGIMLTSLAVTYIIGLFGFVASFQYFLGKPMTLEQATVISVAPFLPFDLVKAVMAGYLGIKIRRALRRAGIVAVQ